MTKLRISPDQALPLDAATRRLAILAMSGAGKSNVAVVLAEQMFDAGIPWVAIDPKGDWWGIRSSGDGKSPGLPIPIFGGLHGDVPLEHTAGKLIGELIVEQRLTCVLDISEFEDRQKQWGFLIDLGETLLRKNRNVLHLFLEEADEYLPQRTSEKGNLPKCLGVWQRVVKRGRFRGIGSTQITQRNASLNKDTLYMAEALIAMRVTGKADREAVRGWVEYHNASNEIVNSLPTLADGEAWITSPAWLKVTKRVQFNRRRTFDSGATPVMLKGSAPIATLADINLDTLRTRMAATIEKAKQDDPKALRAEIATLKKQLAAGPTKTVEKPVADEKAIARAVAAAVKPYAAMIEKIRRLAGNAMTAGRGIIDLTEGVESVAATAPNVVEVSQRPSAIRSARAARPPVAHVRDSDLSRGAQKLLDAVAKLASINIDEPTRSQVAALAGVSTTSSTTDVNFGFLTKNDYLVPAAAGCVRLTDKGRSAAAPVESPPTLDEYVEEWRRLLGNGAERKLYDAYIGWEKAPRPIARTELAALANISSTSSTTDTGFGKLLGLELFEKAGAGEVKAGPTMFPEGLV